MQSSPDIRSARLRIGSTAGEADVGRPSRGHGSREPQFGNRSALPSRPAQPFRLPLTCAALAAAAPAGLHVAPSGARRCTRRLASSASSQAVVFVVAVCLEIFLYFFICLSLLSSIPHRSTLLLSFLPSPPTTPFPGLVLDLEHLTLGVRGQEPNQATGAGGQRRWQDAGSVVVSVS